MKILIVAATELEINSSISFLVEQNIDYLITGVGMVSTAYSLGNRLANQHYDLLVNVGIAGSFNPEHALGSLHRIKHDRLYRFGAENRTDFIPIEQMGFGESQFSEHIPEQPLPYLYYNLPFAEAITVNTVHGESTSIMNALLGLSKDSLESMEGAAFFYSAQQAGIPAIQIRAVSNWVLERDTGSWDIPKALQSLNQWLQEFITAQKSDRGF